MTSPNTYLFTIGIPAYNAEQTITETIHSTLQQTDTGFFEVLIVNDGSSDATESICRQFAEQYSNIRLINTENQGPLLARREIAKNALGEYIIFLDADDLLQNETVAICKSIIDKKEVDMIFFNYSMFNDFTKPQRHGSLKYGLYERKGLWELYRHICRGESNQLCFKVIRKVLFDLSNDYSTYKAMKHGEDLFQLLPIIEKAKSVLYINNCLYFYRRSNTSGTFHYSDSQLNNIDTLAQRLIVYGKKWHLESDALQGAILQYCYLFKILFRDNSLDVSSQSSQYVIIRKRIVGLIEASQFSALKGLSLSWKCFIKAVQNNHMRIIKFLIRLSK